MKKIFIVSSSFDLTCDYMINRYSASIEFFRFNLDKYDRYTVNINNRSQHISDSHGRSCSFDESTSIWFRKPTLPNFDMPKEDLEFAHKEIFTQIEGLLEGHEGAVIEKPCKLRRANNKILQMKLATQIGFIMPESHISNDRIPVLERAKIRKQIIKPISIGKILGANNTTFLQTELLDVDDDVKNLCFCPSYFQDYIRKDYEIRLTVVGEEFFGVKIESKNSIDWRKDPNNDLSLIDVPNDIKDKCLMMMNVLDIKFGAFDFIVSDGSYYFLEVNPNGQWLWLEQKLRLNISKSLINLLTGE